MAAVPFREAFFTAGEAEDCESLTANLGSPRPRSRRPSPVPEIAPRLGRYRLGPRLGRGGMAEVFAATVDGAAGFERAVCIKRILSHYAADAEFRALFLSEAKLAGTLCHSNLVQVFDCVEHDDSLVLVMEMVEGVDLKCLFHELRRKGRTVSAGVIAYIAGQLLNGLRYAHEKKVVHRDVSPHNILVSRHGEVKLADFGVAKAMITHATRTGTLKGKLAYMSPEQASARPVDHRTDLYSAGLVLYEIATGTRFFPISNQSELLSLVSRAQQPSLPNVEPPLAIVIERLLAPSPDDRFNTAQEALDALPPWDVLGPAGSTELADLVRSIELDRRSPASATATRDARDTTEVDTPPRGLATESTSKLSNEAPPRSGHIFETPPRAIGCRCISMSAALHDDPPFARSTQGADRTEDDTFSGTAAGQDSGTTQSTRSTRRPRRDVVASPKRRIGRSRIPIPFHIISLAAIFALILGMALGTCGRCLSTSSLRSDTTSSGARRSSPDEEPAR